ncbi:MAG: threonine ammonia-lyase [Armatimonadota bacterium]
MIELDRIEQACQRIAHIARQTPVVPCDRACDRCGRQVLLKLESLQYTGAFKIRGAANCIGQIAEQARQHGVVAASAGNHSQGVAAAADAFDVDAHIYMPESTPFLKVERTRYFGGTVLLHGDTFDEAYAEACRAQEREGRIFVHPFADERIIAGQGTIGLEICEQVPDCGSVLIPVGGGGLASGIASAVRQLQPDARIIGVQAENAPAMTRAFHSGKREPVPCTPTIAEGIAVGEPDELTYSILSETLDDMVLVSEAAIAQAMLDLIEDDNLVAEGAGAVGLAALAELHEDLPGPIVIVISGGNVDITTVGSVIDRGLAVAERTVRLRVVLPDVPGALADLAAAIGQQDANIIEIFHNRLTGEVHIGRADVEVVLLTRGPEHAKSVIARLNEAGYEARRVH